jgi:hypothetical protein
MLESQRISQPQLFDFSDSSAGTVELFPTVWTALELFISSEVNERLDGLDQLVSLSAHRLSPLVAYVIATGLADSNLNFRYQIVQALGGLLAQNGSEVATTRGVYQTLKKLLSKMRRRSVYALIEVAVYYPSSLTNVASLLKACSHAGGTLSDIFLDRKLPIELRRQSINLAGIVGFLDVVPALERLAGRLESRMEGQRSMPFAPPADNNEKSLLTNIQTVLTILNSP